MNKLEIWFYNDGSTIEGVVDTSYFFDNEMPRTAVMANPPHNADTIAAYLQSLYDKKNPSKETKITVKMVHGWFKDEELKALHIIPDNI